MTSQQVTALDPAARWTKGTQVGVRNSIVLVTPSYRRDLSRCELLCETVDRWVTSFAKHYVIVADADRPLFAKLNSAHREVLAASDLLPSGLRPLPAFLRRGTRRY